MNKDDIILMRLNKLVYGTTREIKIVLSDCSISEMDKIDEIECIIRLYKNKLQVMKE